MSQITRRQFGITTLLGATGLLSPAALAAASTARPAVTPALVDLPLGRYTLTALLDGIFYMPSHLYSGDDPAAIAALARKTAGGPDAFPFPVTAYLLQSAERTILIDAGFGDLEAFGPGFGRARTALAATGVTPEDVDTVIVTHLHPDHIPGLLAGQAPAFPNAELIIYETEVQHWTDDSRMGHAPEPMRLWFRLANEVLGAYGDQVTRVQDGFEAAPGVRLESSPGHTPGHSLVHIDGGEHELLMLADTVSHIDLATALPRTRFAFETDTVQAVESRLRVFDKVAADQVLIAGSHIHFPGFGRIVRDGGAYRYTPVTV
ncbi:MAG: MBL fold metallo-hydrolase [Pseudomonadota bacterium]